MTPRAPTPSPLGAPTIRLLDWLTRAAGLLGLLLASAASPARAEAAGPWRVQVVDAETQAPLAGVVVVAVWERRRDGDMEIGYGRQGVVAVVEAETDATGRLVIPARLFVQPPLAYGIRGPALTLFTAGYGGWRFRGRERLTGAGAVIEMRPLPTRRERIAYLEPAGARDHAAARAGWSQAEEPPDLQELASADVRRFEAAVNAARAAVGLGPTGFGVPNRAAATRRPLEGAPRPWPPSGVEIGPPALRTGGSGLLTLGAMPSGVPAGPPPLGPAGLAADDLRVYVTEPARHQVRVFSRTGTPLATWGREGTGPGEFRRPLGIAVDAARGRVYVTDAGNRRVQVFTPAGAWVASWAPPERAMERFQVPGAIAVDPAGRVFVADALTRTLWQFAPDGTALLGRDGPAEALAVDRLGQLYGLRGDQPWIDVALPAEAPLGWSWSRLPVPAGLRVTGLAVRDPDAVYVIDRPRHRVVRLDRTGLIRDTWGQPGGAPGQLWQPHALALDPTGQLYVSDLGNARIQSLTPAGALGPAWGGFLDPLPPSAR